MYPHVGYMSLVLVDRGGGLEGIDYEEVHVFNIRSRDGRGDKEIDKQPPNKEINKQTRKQIDK